MTYANAEGFDPEGPSPAVDERPVLDRWVLSRLAHTVAEARDGLDAYDATGAGRAIQAFVDDLSNWYVRRSRRRFWNPGGAGDTGSAAAFHTLYECLVTVATLLAPFTPFVSDALWRNLAAGRGDRPDSVHLADYPEPDRSAMLGGLESAMMAARAIVGLGRTVRVETKTRVRQPLAEAVVHYAGDHEAIAPLLDIIADELNVQRVVFAETADELGRWRAKPNLPGARSDLGPSGPFGGDGARDR